MFFGGHYSPHYSGINVSSTHSISSIPTSKPQKVRGTLTKLIYCYNVCFANRKERLNFTLSSKWRTEMLTDKRQKKLRGRYLGYWRNLVRALMFPGHGTGNLSQFYLNPKVLGSSSLYLSYNDIKYYHTI